jgi:hypothetical protein
MQVGKWVRNVALATHAILGGARRQKRGRVVRETTALNQSEARKLRQRAQSWIRLRGRTKSSGGIAKLATSLRICGCKKNWPKSLHFLHFANY